METNTGEVKELNSSKQSSDEDRQANPGNGEQGAKGLTLDKWQQEILDHKGHLLLCTGRQVGKTTIFAIKAAQYMINHPNSRIIVVSLTEDQAHLIIIMILTYLEQNYKKYIAKKAKKPTKSSITLTNKSKVISRPVGNTGDAVRGFTGDVLIADEASRMPESMWSAAKPTLLTTGGQIWMCSTPAGKAGYFYECFQNKHNRFKVFHQSSEDVIYNRKISNSWTKERRREAIRNLDEEKEEMSELEYGQEFLGMFLDDLRRLFSDPIIEQTLTLDRRETIHRERLHFLGCDIARMGDDEGTYEIIDRIEQDNLQHVESIITTKKLTTETYDRIVQLESQYNFKQIGIDAGAGSLGVGILDFLLRDPTTRSKVIPLNNLSRPLDKHGDRKRTLLKEDMYFNMLALMEKGKIKLLKDDKVALSLRSVQYEYIRKPGQPTKIRIFGNYTHIVEGLVRAAWLANQKHLNSFISYM